MEEIKRGVRRGSNRPLDREIVPDWFNWKAWVLVGFYSVAFFLLLNFFFEWL